jgi:hypothetical protein
MARWTYSRILTSDSGRRRQLLAQSPAFRSIWSLAKYLEGLQMKEIHWGDRTRRSVCAHPSEAIFYPRTLRITDSDQAWGSADVIRGPRGASAANAAPGRRWQPPMAPFLSGIRGLWKKLIHLRTVLHQIVNEHDSYSSSSRAKLLLLFVAATAATAAAGTENDPDDAVAVATRKRWLLLPLLLMFLLPCCCCCCCCC